MRIDKNKRKNRRGKILAGAGLLALGLFSFSTIQQRQDAARLISMQPLPDLGESCDRNLMAALPGGRIAGPAPAANLFSAFEPTVHAQDAGNTVEINRAPVRELMDTAPTYSSVSVDTAHDEVYLQDSNLWSIRVFSRLDNAKPGGPPTEPRRIIRGPNTALQFNSCVYIDPAAGDVYSVENDTGNIIAVYPREATGDFVPKRILTVTHRAYAMTINPDTKELFLSVQFPPQIAVYNREASGKDKPLRLIQGPNTGLSDSHGIAVDAKRKLLFVNNWGNIADLKVAGTGRFEPPSISVYPIDADGDARPLRVIQGPKTQMDWPGAMSIEPDSGDLYVANDVGQSILVFHTNDQGDVAPARVIHGSKTRLNYPVGVFVDAKNKEVWAANFGNSSATVYPLMGNGDVEPLRVIRSAEENKRSLRFGKTEAIVYDRNREQLLVPN